MASLRWLLPLIFLSLTSHFASVTSQYEFSSCLDKGNYTSESFFRADLNTLLHSLSSNIGDNGFYNASVGEANAIALCRADIQLHACRGCINIVAEEILQRCPNQVQAIMWQQHCMVRYSNESIAGKVAYLPAAAAYATDHPRGPRFVEVRRSLVEDLCKKAVNATRKAAARNVPPVDATDRNIYALVQCSPDLSPEDCASCLADNFKYMFQCCGDLPAAARLYKPSCTIRYEERPFYNITRLEELPTLPPTPPLPPPGNDNDSGTRKYAIIVVSIVVFLITASGVGLFARKRRKQKKTGDPKIDEDGGEISSVESIQYDFGKIRAATNDFSDANKLGQGGFGAVYKGKLQNGREIAVKRLSKNSGQGELEFKNEVLLVARLQHRNLVRLLGFALEGIEKLLVYEFVKNGSLDHFIFDRIKTSSLDWDRRHIIIRGIARGLLYLHEDSRHRIIHRDLKAGNVLLDEEMNPKISDFGLAKLVVPDATQESTSRIVGTYGYMAPEYAFQGHCSIKSDVYSFGVLILEIVSGKKMTCFQNEESSGDLLSHAWRSWREGTSSIMIDPVLLSTCGGAQQDMLRCIHIALLCVQQNPDDRPTMSVVVLMLNSFSLSLPLPSEPGFYIAGGFSDASLSLGREYNSNPMENSLLNRPAISSGNNSSITNIYPR